MMQRHPRLARSVRGRGRRRSLSFMTALVDSAIFPAATQAYLARALTLVVSFEPRGSTDFSARVMAQGRDAHMS
jgi:tripartite-type tricarboxylate transporter receptor subunit TctC